MAGTPRNSSNEPTETGATLAPPKRLELNTRLDEILHSPNYTPEALLDALRSDPELAELLRQPAVREGYSIEEHTLMVLRQFEKYFGEIELPTGITRAEMRLLISLHDIGKGIGADRGEQYDHTMHVLETLRDAGLFSADTFKLIVAPLSMDTLGKYLYKCVANGPGPEAKLMLAQKIADGAATRADFNELATGILMIPSDDLRELAIEASVEIRAMATKAALPIKELFSILTIYYQCDTLAYTYDAARDHLRSQVLSPEMVGNIKFNHDRALTAYPGLQARSGERSWEYYSRLETAARSGVEPSYPLKRGYPSLDFLYRYSDDFDPADTTKQPQMFVLNSEKKRLYFNVPFNHAYRTLENILGV